MKKSYQLVCKLLISFVVVFGFSQVGLANEKDVTLEIKDNSKDQLVIKLTNEKDETLKSIKGKTTFPKELKEEFSSEVVDWQIPELKSKESQEIIVERVNKSTDKDKGNKDNQSSKSDGDKKKGLIPQLGEGETKAALQLIGFFLTLTLGYLFIKKKKHGLLLLLIGINLFGGATALAIEQQIETTYQGKNGKELIFATALSYDVVSNQDGDGEETDEGSIRVTGSALDSEGKTIPNKELVFKSAEETISTTTDETGYFYVKVNKGQSYTAEITDQLTSQLVVNELLDYSVTDEQGTLYLGKRIVNEEVPDAYVKLGIESIYINPDKVSLLEDGRLQISEMPDLEAEDIIVVGESDKYPNGIITKTSQISVIDKVSTITGSEVMVEEVFEEIHTPKEGPTFKKAEMELAKDVKSKDKLQRAAFALDIHKDTSFTAKAEVSLDTESVKGEYVERGVSLNLSGDIGVTGDFSLDYAPRKAVLESEFSISPFVHGEVSLNTKLETTEKFEDVVNQKIADTIIHSTVPFISISMPVNVKLEPSLEGKAGISSSISVEPKYGFAIKGLSAELINEPPKDIFSMNEATIEGKASLGIKSEVAPSLELGLNNRILPLSTSLIEVSSDAGPEISTEYEKTLEKASKGESAVDLAASVEIKPFKAIADKLEESGLSLGAEFSGSRNIWKTGELDISRVDFQNTADEIKVQKGETVKLNITNRNGEIVTPKLVTYSSKKFADFNPQTSELTIKNSVNNGDEFEIGFMDYLVPGWFTQAKVVTFKVGTSEEEGTLKGLITEFLNDQPLKGAKLSFFDGDKNLVKETTTDANGEYSVELPKGIYQAEVNAEGYIPETQYDIVINKKETKFNAKLKLVGLDYSDIGQVSGQITDATNNKGIPTVSLTFRKGIDSKVIEPIAEVESDESGNYLVNLPGGNYTMEMKKNGYVTGYTTVVAVGKQEKGNQGGSITPILDESEKVRIVLTWKEHPRDLDSHLTGLSDDKQSRFHIYYKNKNYEDSENSANLDVDDRYSYGPETVTILNKINEGTYTYAVHRYAGQSTLAASEAKVEVFMENQLVNTFNVPTGEGDLWKVFEIRNGIVVPINQMTTSSSHPPKVDELLPIG